MTHRNPTKTVVQNRDGRLIEITTYPGGPKKYKPMSWNSVPDYLRWMADNWQQLTKENHDNH